jgi:hypothetical protein
MKDDFVDEMRHFMELHRRGLNISFASFDYFRIAGLMIAFLINFFMLFDNSDNSSVTD